MNPTGYLARRLIRSPGFSAMVVGTIGLAIAINVGVLTIVRSILFASMGVPSAQRLVYYTLGGASDNIPNLSLPAYGALRSDGMVKELLAWMPTQVRVQMRTGSTRVTGALVTGNAFSVLQVRPALGRFFSDADDRADGGANGWPAVLSYDYWETQFGADPEAIGTTMLVDGQPVHILGVLPKEFRGLQGLPPALMLPRSFLVASHIAGEGFEDPGNLSWYVFGRMSEGMSLGDVQANLRAIEPSVRRQADPDGTVFPSLFPNVTPGTLIQVKDGRRGVVSAASSVLGVMVTEGLAVSVSLFCFCNLVLLFAGRAKQEMRSAAIRQALGAMPSHEIRFSVLESTVLAGLGCMVGLPAGWLIVRSFALLIQSILGIDVFPMLAPGARLLATVTGIALIIGCCTGIGLVLWHARHRSSITLRTGSGVTSRQPNWIIGFEVFAAVLLITTASVGGLGLRQLMAIPAGFATDGAVMATLDLSRAERSETLQRVLERAGEAPGVQAVAMTNLPPLSGGTATTPVRVRGENGTLEEYKVWPATVSVRYFVAMGTGIVRGRAFANEDIHSDPVCVLSERAASLLFKGREPLGSYLFQAGGATTIPWCRVVGIAADAHFTSMSEPVDPVVYSLSADPLPTIIVRANNGRLAGQALGHVIRALDPGIVITGTESLGSLVNRDLRMRRVITVAGGLCACLAAAVLCIGFFGVLSVRVAERRQEIGVRIALGASRVDVCFAISRALRRPVAAGLSAGSLLALPASMMLAQTCEIGFSSVAWSYVASVALLGLLSCAAAAVPIRRALRVSPQECLVSE